jgi:hexosaminidase
MGIVREIVDQVMAVHKDAKYLHIGCDEVFHLGECSECLGVGRTSIFTDHVTRVAQYVRQAYQVTPIIWDDMLRNLIVEEMQPLAKLVEPMVWVYAEDVERFVPSYTWDRYNKVFDYFWTASAFKGAHGETLVVPDVQRHLNNNLNWLALMAQEEPRIRGGFRGIVLTGWQRYDHFAVLCELLPAAIPSLAVNLLATSHGFFNETLEKPLAKALGCVQHTSRYSSSLVDLQNDNFLWTGLSWCYFPGTNFFKVTKNLVGAEREVREFLHKVESKKGWLTEYNRRHNMSSPFRIDEGLEDWSQVHHSVVSIMQGANAALLEMFDHYTVSEWIEQKLYPLYSKLSSIKNQADDLRRVKYWPARPYPPLEALKGLGIGVPDIQESAELRRTPEPKFSKFIDQDNFV